MLNYYCFYFRKFYNVPSIILNAYVSLASLLLCFFLSLYLLHNNEVTIALNTVSNSDSVTIPESGEICKLEADASATF